MSALWQDERDEQRSASLALVWLDTALVCPDCGELVETITLHEPALFFHGGYGADRETCVRLCAECDWLLVYSVGESRPLRAAS